MPADDNRDIAIIGMTCRFPGASDLDSFWSNLLEGRDTVTRYPRKPVDGGRAGDDYVPAHGLLNDPEAFDAGFFRISPREARLLSPQHRLFLECAAEVIEGAGYDHERYAGRVGVYAGGAETGYAQIVRSQLDRLAPVGEWEILFGTAPEYMASRVAYKLDLRGPSLAVQAACATALVAVHVAIQGLLAGDCDMALAGAAAVHAPARLSPYVPGGVISKNGACRTFDAAADGIVGSDGVGLVVLKRLEQALSDGDIVHAVVRGSAINNDGAHRIGFTAPSMKGQARAIRDAMRNARIDAASIGYVEAHGTATPLGDPIELAALNEVYREATDTVRGCPIGSVKSNIGHTDVAAGAAGLIKACLALSTGKIPPSLHFERANAGIDFERSPFRVVTELEDWPADRQPRRAAVSAFGIGGVNAHVVLEQAPERVASPGRSWQLLPWSAERIEDLGAVAARLSDHLRGHPAANLADVAWTLQVGRREQRVRRCALARDCDEAITAIVNADYRPASEAGTPTPVAFRFSGRTDPAEIRRLMAYEPSLQGEVEACLAAARTRSQGVGIFAAAYAEACLLERWGIRPSRIVGDGAGVWAAAAFTGLLSPGQAVATIEARDASEEAFAAAVGALPDSAPARVQVVLARDRVLEPGQHIVAGEWPSIGAACGGATNPPSDIGDWQWVEIASGAEASSWCGAGEPPPRALLDLAATWRTGLPVAWSAVHEGQRRRRVRLPTFPFQRTRYHLLEAGEQQPTRKAPPVPTDTATDEMASEHIPEKISRLFAEALSHEGVGIDDDFFELGGDSLIATALFARLNASFRLELDAWSIYEAPTPRQLADVVEQSRAEAHA